MIMQNVKPYLVSLAAKPHETLILHVLIPRLRLRTCRQIYANDNIKMVQVKQYEGKIAPFNRWQPRRAPNHVIHLT